MMMACNPVAKKPYMNLVLNNNVTDTGTGANTPSNTGVTFTTDQFGRANMAGNWDVNTDYLEWLASVGNTIAGYLNNNGTIVYFINLDTAMSTQGSYAIFNQWSGGENQRSFMFGGSEFLADDSYWIAISENKFAFTSYPSSSSVVDFNVWDFYSIKINGTSKIVSKNNSVISNQTTINASTTSTNNLRLGRRTDFAASGFRGNLNNFRIYNVYLSDGQLKILNSQKGRISA